MTGNFIVRTLLTGLLSAVALVAQPVTVNSALPNSAGQGTLNLNVTISGKGFKKGAVSQFFVTGTTNPGGISVTSTSFVSSSSVIANINVSDTAVISGFDIALTNPDGTSGKGSDSFAVLAPTANGKCTSGSLPAGVTLAATLNPTSGSPVYTGNLGKTVRGVLTTVLGRSVVMAVAGGLSGHAEVFFLDPATGAVLDGTWGQPHLTLPTPEPSFNYLALGDVNGDGVPDIAVGSGEYGIAAVFLAEGGGSSALTFSPYILLNPTQSNSGNNAALAIGYLGGAYNTIAVGTSPSGTSRKITPGMVALYRFNGTGFTNYSTIIDPQQTTSSFGWSIAIGDVTGDSVPDLVVGAANSNRVWVFPSGGVNGQFYISGSTGDTLGYGVAAANLTGPAGGYNDLVSLDSNSSTNQSAFIFSGPVTSASTPALRLQPVFADASVGAALDFGDLDGDGLADMAFGAPNSGCGGTEYLYLSGSGFSASLIPSPVSTSTTYGSATAVVAGTHILLVGDKNWGSVQSGQVYVYLVP